MKGKYLFGALFMAVLGGAIALFTYTKIVGKPASVVSRTSSVIDSPVAKPMLASFEIAEGQQVDFTYAAEQTVHAVVHVHVVSKVEQPDNPILQFFYGDNFRNSPREVSGYGSGVIISPDGYIITNNHVIEDADNIEVKLNDNRIFKAELVGRDPSTDIALLKIKADNLSYLKYGDSDKLKVGEWVLAVGNPFNLTSTVTAGIVSAKGRDLQLINSSYSIESYIQTDAALNPGNSGGALVDTKGLLVGITSAIISPSGAYAGYSFAVPVSIVSKVVDDIRQYGAVQRALIGIEMHEVTADEAEKQNLNTAKGIIITKIVDGGGAEEAKMKKDDIITKMDGISVDSPNELQEQVGKHHPGDKVMITYFRDGKENTVPVTLKNIAGNTSVVTKGMGVDEIFGARFETLSNSEKQMFNTDYGVKIVSVSDGKFKDIGLRKGTILLSINGKKVKTPEEVRQVTNNEKTLKSIEGFQPDGTYFSYKFGN
ncbi:MAG: Do family serine endopeptidase [Bacteroidales bacterium]